MKDANWTVGGLYFPKKNMSSKYIYIYIMHANIMIFWRKEKKEKQVSRFIKKICEATTITHLDPSASLHG